MTTKFITLNVWDTDPVRVKVNQGEVNSRFLRAQFIDKNQPLDLEGKTVFFYAKKPDGNLIFNTCEIIDEKDGTVNLAVTSQMSIVSGKMKDCEFQVIDADLSKLKIKGLIFEIEPCTDYDSAVESTSEFSVLDKSIKEVQSLLDEFSDENFLEKIKSVDGAGSGIDADLLDGKHGSEYATIEQFNSTVPQSRTINSKSLSSDIELTCDDVGAAKTEHTHAASDITSGKLSIENGGTGAASVTGAQSALKIFTDVSQLNVDYPCTTGDIVNAMPSGSIGFFNVEASSSTVTDVASEFSFLEIYKATPNRVRVLLNSSSDDSSSGEATFNIGQYNAQTHSIESWKRIQTSAFATPINCGGTGATTEAQALENLGATPKTRTINSKALISDIELSCADVGAAAENHVHDFNSISEKPTTIEGYGITDAVPQSRMINSKTLISDIELSCTDIGAAPYEAKSSTDFNEMQTPGLYTMRSSTANAPTGGSYHSLIVNKSDNGNYVQQIAIKESSYEVYVRYLNGSNWSAWKQISMADHVQSIDKGGTGATTASTALSNLHGVEMTTSAVTYYISPSGSDSNSGESASSPFKTLAYALSKLPKFLKHDVTINVAQGTYSENEVLITGFVGEGSLSIVGTYEANAVGAENYMFPNGIKINKNQGRVELHGIGSSDGFRVLNSPDVVFYYCHAYSQSLVAGKTGFFSTHSKVFTVYCRVTNFQNGFHSYQGGDLTAMFGVCTNCSYPWCSGEGAVLYAYGGSSSGFISAHNYSSAGVIVGTYGGTIGI